MLTDWRWEEACEQVRARERNERSAAGRPRGDPARLDRYACECGHTSCRDAITLTREEYEVVRSDATWFAVAPNHENPEIDHVVSEHPRFSTVVKVTWDLVRVARTDTALAS